MRLRRLFLRRIHRRWRGNHRLYDFRISHAVTAPIVVDKVEPVPGAILGLWRVYRGPIHTLRLRGVFGGPLRGADSCVVPPGVEVIGLAEAADLLAAGADEEEASEGEEAEENDEAEDWHGDYYGEMLL